MTTFIVGAMPLDDEYVRTLIESVPEKDRFIIACDKGYYYINMAGYSPDLVVGDFDSADSDLYEQLMRDGKEVIKLNPIKRRLCSMPLNAPREILLFLVP